MNAGPNATHYKSHYVKWYVVPMLVLLIPAALVVGFVWGMNP